MLAGYLYKQVREFLKEQPNANFLEIGSFDGEGITGLCKEFPNNKFYSIDPFLEDGNTEHITGVGKGKELTSIKKVFDKNTVGCSNLIYFRVTTEQFISKYYIGVVNILLIDGDHSYETCSIDLKLATLLANKSELIVLMDDIYLQGVQKALNEFKQVYSIKTIKIPNEEALYFTLDLRE